MKVLYKINSQPVVSQFITKLPKLGGANFTHEVMELKSFRKSLVMAFEKFWDEDITLTDEYIQGIKDQEDEAEGATKTHLKLRRLFFVFLMDIDNWYDLILVKGATE